MKKLWVWFCVLLIVVLSSYGQCRAQARFTLFEDQFDDNRNGWFLGGDRPKTLAKIDSGSFYLESRRITTGYSRWITQGFFHKNQDFEIVIRLKQVKGNNLRGYALQWGGDPVNNRFHEVWLRRDQKFSVSTFDNLRDTTDVDHIGFTYTDAIKPMDYNQLRIRKEGNKVTYLINGAKVHEMPFVGLFGPEIGFICPAKGAIRVDYLKIELLNKSPLPIFSNQNSPNIFIISVGIADYENTNTWEGFSNLRFTTNDAKSISEFFTNKNVGAVPESNVSLLLNKKATKTRILSEMKQQVAKAWSNDLVIFYFAGHGISGEAQNNSPLYLLPYDYELGNLQSAIHYKEIEAIFESIPTKNKMIIMDACHSGGSLPELNGSFHQILGSLGDKEIAILTSSGLGETSLELGNKQRGLFSYYLMEGLTFGAELSDTDRDGVVTVIELYSYAREQTAASALKEHHIQNPKIGGKFNTQLPLRVIRPY